MALVVFVFASILMRSEGLKKTLRFGIHDWGDGDFRCGLQRLQLGSPG
ncbi:MAG: hypothetical protein PHD01_06200 [Geobacteraceae bacterium]|nr:hypothetical protein [Geobacteraceae bacterium]